MIAMDCSQHYGRSRLFKALLQFFFCPTCKKILSKPTTGTCGHTRCAVCTYASPCICGVASRTPLQINKILQSIVDEMYNLKLFCFPILDPKRNELKHTGSRKIKRLSKRNLRTVNAKSKIAKIHGEEIPFWLQRADIECPICKETFTYPLTAPCGHMFCRLCLERHLYYTDSCPLCNTRLKNLNVHEISQTKLMAVVLNYLGRYKPPTGEYHIPILKVGTGYPSVPCSIIFNYTGFNFMYSLMSSPKPMFGLVEQIQEECCNVGTVIKITDCVQLPNGNLFVTGIGLRRFEVLEAYHMPGYDLGRVTNIFDIHVPKQDYDLMTLYTQSIVKKAKIWLANLEPDIRQDLEYYYGMPSLHEVDVSYRYDKNGPFWLWRLMNVLPVKKFLLNLLLKETDVGKRFEVVEHMLRMAIHGQDISQIVLRWFY